MLNFSYFFPSSLLLCVASFMFMGLIYKKIYKIKWMLYNKWPKLLQSSVKRSSTKP